ncbi:MAG: amidase [Candidatus Lambdaproteobacteria bacterium]|nr:amidase [Candidatus Lambdaproteobacteria bacterium]
MALRDELAFMDATAQAELVRRKALSPLELVEAAIERIERLNPRLNAVITPMYDLARRAAGGALPEGPFRGVPMVLKDLVAEYAGVRLCEGSAFLREYVSPHDSELVARYKRAGLVIVGKSNTPEFGSLPTTEPALFGPTRNPWDVARTPGGSSGGSAAAVASGMVPVGHANDGGGSIRVPASCCGLVGLKPTRARNPLGPDYGDGPGGVIHEHVVTRSVRDTAAILDCTAGPDTGAPYMAPPPARPFLREVGADPGRLRIALSTAPLTGIGVHDDCAGAARDVARLCAQLGHTVEEAAPRVSIADIGDKFAVLWVAFVAWAVRDWERRTGRTPTADQFEPGNWIMVELDARRRASDYLLAVQDLQRLAREVAAFCEGYDVWLTPTLAQPPMPLGYFDHDRADKSRSKRRQAEYSNFTMITNITGQPSITLPLTWNAAGLPIGTHFTARYGDEATLLRLAAQLEAARPWAGRRPPVAA